MKKLNSRQIAHIKNLMKPGQKLVEVVLTVRWVTDKDLEDAVEELTNLTGKFNPEMRADGYLNAKVLIWPSVKVATFALDWPSVKDGSDLTALPTVDGVTRGKR